MTRYAISDVDRPWVTLFSSLSLDTVAEALAAQPGLAPSRIYASIDGKSRSLNAVERIALFRKVIELRPHDPVATAELSAAQRDADSACGTP